MQIRKFIVEKYIDVRFSIINFFLSPLERLVAFLSNKRRSPWPRPSKKFTQQLDLAFSNSGGITSEFIKSKRTDTELDRSWVKQKFDEVNGVFSSLSENDFVKLTDLTNCTDPIVEVSDSDIISSLTLCEQVTEGNITVVQDPDTFYFSGANAEWPSTASEEWQAQYKKMCKDAILIQEDIAVFNSINAATTQETPVKLKTKKAAKSKSKVAKAAKTTKKSKPAKSKKK